MAASAERTASQSPVEHFAAFSFVDHIVEFEPGRRARGKYWIPDRIDRFPSCLVAEAVGQLAAWVAMKHVAFSVRPVAALANETRFHGSARPGDTLDLSVDVEHCDEHAVAYSGRARIGAADVIELIDCLGPMRPTAEFDSPAALAARFELIRGDGARPGAFGGVPTFGMVRSSGESARSAEATLNVPESAPFFGDHFPNRPVFPATLLLDVQMMLAMEFANEAMAGSAGSPLSPTRITHVKMREFIPPGSIVTLGAELGSTNETSATLRLSAKMDDKNVATARLELALGAKS